MVYPIEYNREQGRLLRLEAFSAARRADAEDARLEPELALVEPALNAAGV